MSINQALHCLKGMNDGGWLPQGGSHDAFSQFPLAQFYVYSHAKVDSFVTAISIDNFLKNVSFLHELPEAAFDPSFLSGEIARLSQLITKDKSVELQHQLAVTLNAYMITTQSGAKYFETALGRPFAFVVIMYPANKEHTQFISRPVVIGADKVLSTSDLEALAGEVGSIDLANGHADYFQFI